MKRQISLILIIFICTSAYCCSIPIHCWVWDTYHWTYKCGLNADGTAAAICCPGSTPGEDNCCALDKICCGSDGQCHSSDNNQACCDNKVMYSMDTQQCCGYGTGKLCNNDQTCCKGTNGETCCNSDEGCCEGQCYNLETQGCCNGIIYNLDSQFCCNNSVVSKIPCEKASDGCISGGACGVGSYHKELQINTWHPECTGSSCVFYVCVELDVYGDENCNYAYLIYCTIGANGCDPSCPPG